SDTGAPGARCARWTHPGGRCVPTLHSPVVTHLRQSCAAHSTAGPAGSSSRRSDVAPVSVDAPPTRGHGGEDIDEHRALDRPDPLVEGLLGVLVDDLDDPLLDDRPGGGPGAGAGRRRARDASDWGARVP